MTYDFILMNPPYNVGNKITSSTINTLCGGKCVCLMPLSCYKNKSNELWRYVESMELADPKMFEGADIVRNLSICILSSDICDVYKSYDCIQELSWDANVSKVFYWNRKHGLVMSIDNYGDGTNEKFDFDTEIIESARLPAIDSVSDASGFHGFRIGDNVGYRINIQKRYDTLVKRICRIKFNKPSVKAKNNFCTWAYKENMFTNLANVLIAGIRLDDATESCLYAIPQIDWETISDTPLWKEGKYDEAVLDVMGLKWDGDVIVEERKL